MPQYETQDKSKLKKVFFTGTTQVKEGQAFCYNWDSTTGGSAGEFDGYRHWQVEKPATANLKYFAGVAAADYAANAAGRVIEIHEPDSSRRGINVWTDISTTAGTTKLALVGGTHAFQAVGNTRMTVANAIQTEDRSSTAGVVQAFLGGTPGPRSAFITLATPTLTGGTTGATTALVGTTAGAVTDIKMLTEAVADVKTDLTAIINTLKKQGQIDMS